MTSEIVNENPESLSSAARKHPAFRGLCGRTLTRYALIGVLKNGVRVKLGYLRVGGRLMTSRPALDRFLTELNDRPPNGTEPRSPAKRLTCSRMADAELEKILG